MDVSVFGGSGEVGAWSELKQSYPDSQGLLALVFSLALGGRFLIGPVSGILSDLLTHRVAIMIGGFLLAAGMAAASFSQDLISVLFFLGVGCASVTVVSTYFVKYRTVAFGISLAAPGFGLIGTPYLLRWLIVDHGWRMTMLCFAGILAQICVLGSVYFRRRPCSKNCRDGQTPPEEEQHLTEANIVRKDCAEEESESTLVTDSLTGSSSQESGSIDSSTSSPQSARSPEKKGSADSTPVTGIMGDAAPQNFSQRIKALLCNKFLWVICLNQMMMTAGYATSLNFFPAYAQSVGVAFEDLPKLYTAYGLTLIVTRVTGGFVFSRMPGHLLTALFLVGVGFALVQLLLPLYGLSLLALVVERILTGAMYGPSLLLVTPILDHYLGPKNLPVAFGFVMLCSGLGSVAVPPIAGALYDAYGTYNVCCYIAGSAGGVAALSLIFSLLIKDSRPSKG
ncbi:monocarboxylate transporter 12-B-like [Babylonia areolata]|uniref:monocarboxylate transporter 12-B-like n=1 Tax=Babylonia areolata TaxID=304850 RepID=UPI003FD343B7